MWPTIYNVMESQAVEVGRLRTYQKEYVLNLSNLWLNSGRINFEWLKRSRIFQFVCWLYPRSFACRSTNFYYKICVTQWWFAIERFLTFLKLRYHSGENLADMVLKYLCNDCKWASVSADDSHITMQLTWQQNIMACRKKF
jgi:hypothetical protein